MRRIALEALEDRRLLAGLGNHTDDVTLGRWFSDAAPVGSAQAAEVAPTEEWIVQLTADATTLAGDVPGARSLLWTTGRQLQVLRGLGLPGLLLVAARLPATETQSLLAAHPLVRSFEQNRGVAGELQPNDPRYLDGSLPGLENNGSFGTNDADIDAPAAWDLTTGDPSVVVGVIDSGVALDHPDLYQNIWIHQGEIPPPLQATLQDSDGDSLITFRDLNHASNAALVSDSNGNGYIDAYDLLGDPTWADQADNEGNGFVDDLFGWDFVGGGTSPQTTGDNDPTDEHGHGTHVAGTIGAAGNNGIGVTGITWSSSLMALRFLDENRAGQLSDAISAINYATMMRSQFGVHMPLTNNSWGYRGAESELLRIALQANAEADMLFVAAAGNGDALGFGIDNDASADFAFYPASDDLDHIVSVAATDSNDRLARFSNYGASSVDLAAPGVGVLSTDPLGQGNGGYTIRSGTSMAAPLVAGVAALVWAANPGATAAEVKAALLDPAALDPLAELAPRTATGGRLNALGALSVDRIAPRAVLAELPDVDGPGVSQLTFTVVLTDNRGINADSIDAGAVSVTDVFDGAELAGISLLGSVTAEDGKRVEATFRVTAPGGAFEDGDYQVALRPGRVFDTQANAAAAAVLGTFNADTTPNLLRAGTLSDSASADSLRGAILLANGSPEAHTIRLASGTYRLAIAGADDDLASSGDLDLAGTLTIKGAGAERTIIDAAALDRVFQVLPGAVVELRDLSITGGSAIAGGGVMVAEGGTLLLRRVMIHGNGADEGGGLYNGGALEVYQSTVHGNLAHGGGGGLHNASGATATLENATVSNNMASGEGQGRGGGGLFNAGSLTIRSSTVVENQAGTSGGGLENVAGVVTVVNSIVASNLAATGGDDFQGQVDSLGYNLVGSPLGGSGWTASDLLNIEPELGPLQANGGNVTTHGVWTHLPRIDSPAIDAGSNSEAPAADQRGIARPTDANGDGIATVDIGAVERYFGSVEGVRFLDENENGLRDEGEVGLGGLAVYVDLNQNERFDAGEPLTLTEADGTFHFAGLAPGTYSVVDLPQQGWRQIRFDYGTDLQLISQGSEVRQGNAPSSSPALSADGRYVVFTSAASNLVPNDNNFARDVFLYDRQADRLELLSLNSAGLPGNGDSYNPRISADGSVIVFESLASNLDPLGIDTNSAADIYALDRTAGSLALINVGSQVVIDSVLYAADMTADPGWTLEGGAGYWEYGTPTGMGNGPTAGFTGSHVIGFNLSGQYAGTQNALFATTGPIDVQGQENLVLQFRRWLDIDSAAVDQAEIEVSTDGQHWTYVWSHAGGPLDDAGWKQVTYELPVEDASTIQLRWVLWPTDTTAQFGGWNIDDVVVGTASPARESVAADAAAANPAISADGRFVAYDSMASNIVAGDINQSRDVFLYDRQAATTEIVSLAGNGTQANFHSSHAALSDDGQVVVFESQAQNLDPEGLDIDSSNDIYARDRLAGTTELISVGVQHDTSIDTVLDARDMTTDPGWTLDGGPGHWEYGVPRGIGDDPAAGFNGPSVVGFNLAGDYPGGLPREYATTGAIDVAGHANLVLQYRRWLNIESSQFDQAGIEVSADDGPWVRVWNHVGGPIRDASWQLVSHVLPVAGADTIRLRWYLGTTDGAVNHGGWNLDEVTVGASGSAPVALEANNPSSRPVVSGDGRYVAFRSFATNLVSGDNNLTSDIFVRDRTTGATELVSRAADGTLQANPSENPALSGDGRFVVFHTRSSLVSGDLNLADDVYLHDRLLEETLLISHDSQGSAAGSTSRSAAISSDGQYLAFSSLAANLVAGDTNDREDIFLVQRDSLVIERVNTTTVGFVSNGPSAGAESSENAAMSQDGRYVAFSSTASNLVSGDTNGQSDVFVRDRLSGTIEIVSITAAGMPGNRDSSHPAISADGRYVVFESLATNLVADDLNGWSDVFLYDRLLKTTQIISRTNDGQPATGDSQRPAISGDGNVIAFESQAANLDPLGLDADSESDIVLYDRSTGELELVSRGADGSGADGPSLEAQVSADGNSIVFTSFASNLAASSVDFNGESDVYLYDRATQTVSLISSGTPGHVELGATLYMAEMHFNPGWTLDGGPGQWEYGAPQGASEDPLSGFDGPNVIGFHLAGTYQAGTPRSYATTGAINVAGSDELLLQFRRHLAVEHPSVARAGIEVSADGGPWLRVWENENFVVDFDWQLVTYQLPVTQAASIRLRWYLEASEFAFEAGGWNIDNVTVGVALTIPAAAEGSSIAPAISADGRFVSYVSSAVDLVEGVPSTQSSVYVHDRQQGTTEWIAPTADPGLSGLGEGVSISADGRYVAFASAASTLVANDSNRLQDVFVHNRQTGTTERVNRLAGVQGNEASGRPAISADGRYVSFRSEADNLAAGDLNFAADVFVAPTSAIGMLGIPVLISAGAAVEGIDFGNKPSTGTIRGRLFHDENQDGQRQGSEGALIGWTVYLDANSNGTLDPGELFRVTNSFGEYEFAELLPLETYRLRAVTQTFWVQTTPRLAQGGGHEVHMGAGALADQLDFGFLFRGPDGQSLNQISGVYFLDSNRNGVRDAGETPVAGGMVYIDTNQNAMLDPGEPTQTTDAGGNYLFAGLPIGSFVIRIVGDPSFIRTQPLNNALPPRQVSGPLETTQGLAVGDFNGDLFEDLVVASGDGIYVQLSDQAGGFSTPQRTSAGVGAAGAYTVVAGRFNNDEHLDLAFTNRLTNNLSVMLGNGDGSFTHSTNYTVGLGPHALATGDFNRDGRTDLAVGTEAFGGTRGRISILWNNAGGSGTFSPPQLIHSTTSTNAFFLQAVQLTDDNVDGMVNANDAVDLVVANYDQLGPGNAILPGNVTLLYNGSTGFSAHIELPAGGGPAAVAAGDFDTDGDFDLAVANFATDSVSIYQNIGNGSMVKLPQDVAGGSGPFAITSADVDGDGDVDLVVSGSAASRLLVLRNVTGDDGQTNFSPAETYGSGAFPQAVSSSVSAADFDRDGLPDLAIAYNDNASQIENRSGHVEVYFNAVSPGGYEVTLNGLNPAPRLEFGVAAIVASEVVGRHVFYNNSLWDGQGTAAGAADDAAIATDKTPLLPGAGRATFANYTSYSRGINGVMIDIGGLPAAVTLDPALDFSFRTGNDNNPAGWQMPSVLPGVSIRRGAGQNGSARVTLVWPEQTIVGTWLEITVQATARTGLAAADVFYWGNAPGETGNSAESALVDATDFLGVRANPKNLLAHTTLRNPHDINRDGFVNSTDTQLTRQHATGLAGGLRLIELGAGVGAKAEGEAARAVKQDDLFLDVPEQESRSKTRHSLATKRISTVRAETASREDAIDRLMAAWAESHLPARSWQSGSLAVSTSADDTLELTLITRSRFGLDAKAAP